MIMLDTENCPLSGPKRIPWNKGKLIGAKPPLSPKHVWSIRTKLQLERRVRDLALFNLAIDSKLWACDVVALKVEDVAPDGYAIARGTVRQRKTGRPVRFELTEQTRQAVDDYLKAFCKKPGDVLFARLRLVHHRHANSNFAVIHFFWDRILGTYRKPDAGRAHANDPIEDTDSG
jgi:hypothetical protein